MTVMPHTTSRARRGTRRPGQTQADTAQIVQGLRRIVKALHSYSQDVYRTYGLTGPQLWALKTLEREGRLSAGRLAEALAVHQSSLSILVDRLEKRGLVQRIRAPHDRRVVQIALTKRGAALSTRAPEAAQGRLLYGLRAMSPFEVHNIRQVVDQLVEAMEASDVQARFFFAEG
jgi:MarR family transcriptional regulator, organic hydroperoxide resistance regulator